MSKEKKKSKLFPLGTHELARLYFVMMCIFLIATFAMGMLKEYSLLFPCATTLIVSAILFALYSKLTHDIAMFLNVRNRNEQVAKKPEDATQGLLKVLAQGMLDMVKEQKSKVDKQMTAFDKSYKKAKKQHDAKPKRKYTRRKKQDVVVTPKKRGRKKNGST